MTDSHPAGESVVLPLNNCWSVQVRSTERSDGDFAISTSDVEQRRRTLLGPDWTWLHLEHGNRVVAAGGAGEHAGARADGAFTDQAEVPLAVTTADCAAVVLAGAASKGDGAALAVVHAGWRGLLAGIIEKAAQMVAHSAGPEAELISFCSPCIGGADYEFSVEDLAPLEQRYGPNVRTTSTGGRPALDLFAGVAQALDRSGFGVPERPPSTADNRFFSHRVRVDPERMATVAKLVINR